MMPELTHFDAAGAARMVDVSGKPATLRRAVARGVPADRLIVSESGLATRQDLAQIARYGVRAFLIGEVLMREANVEAATRDLLRSPWTPEAE